MKVDEEQTSQTERASVAGEAPDLVSGFVWHRVNGDDEDTLPPIDKIVWIIYLSGYDDGPVIQLGGRTLEDMVDDDTYGWSWGVLDSSEFAKNWEPKLYGIEVDDDYRVTHWAELVWPTTQQAGEQKG